MNHGVLDRAAWISPWRGLQVAEKASFSLGLVLTALLAPAWPGCPLVALVALAAMLRARIRPRTLALVMSAPLGFIVLGALSVAIGVGGPTEGAWWHWGPFSIGADSARRAVEVSAHAMAGALAMMVLATTTPMTELLAWTRRCGVPAPLVEIASLTYRLLWVLLASTLTIREAQLARLGDAAPVGRRLRTTGDAVGAVLVRSWDRARRLEDGLAGRDYTGALPTLDTARPASPVMRLTTAAALMTIWLLCWLVGR